MGACGGARVAGRTRERRRTKPAEEDVRRRGQVDLEGRLAGSSPASIVASSYHHAAMLRDHVAFYLPKVPAAWS